MDHRHVTSTPIVNICSKCEVTRIRSGIQVNIFRDQSIPERMKWKTVCDLTGRAHAYHSSDRDTRCYFVRVRSRNSQLECILTLSDIEIENLIVIIFHFMQDLLIYDYHHLSNMLMDLQKIYFCKNFPNKNINVFCSSIPKLLFHLFKYHISENNKVQLSINHQ